MYMCSEISGEVDLQMIKSQTKVKTLLAYLNLYSKTPEVESLSCIRQYDDEPMCANSSLREDAALSETHLTSGGLPDGSHLISINASQREKAPAIIPASQSCRADLQSKRLKKAAGTAFFERRPRVEETKRNTGPVSKISAARWRLAAEAIERYPTILESYHPRSHDQSCFHLKPEEFLVHRVQNWPWDDLLRSVDGLVVGMVLWLACFVYGSIHVAAWNEHFPSLPEMWLWRSSSLYIGFCGGLWTVLNYITRSYKPLNAFWERWVDGGGKWWQNLLIGIPVVVCGSSLIFARVFIVIEAFISIRELPAGAYDTPAWSQVFPHF